MKATVRTLLENGISDTVILHICSVSRDSFFENLSFFNFEIFKLSQVLKNNKKVKPWEPHNRGFDDFYGPLNGAIRFESKISPALQKIIFE